jgi:hypothetical protein
MNLTAKIGHAFWVAFCVTLIYFDIAYIWDNTWLGLGCMIFSLFCAGFALGVRLWWIVSEVRLMKK